MSHNIHKDAAFTPGHIFCFGLGYTAGYLADALLALGWKVSGTTRSEDKAQCLNAKGIQAHVWDGSASLDAGILDGITHIVHSIAPGEEGDRVYHQMAKILQNCVFLQWFGYLSTTGVYGNTDGTWVDESAAVKPENSRQQRRVEAEQQWLQSGLPTHIFRLAGIYGPGRNAFILLNEGKARRIIKKNQFFSRIHVEDIVQVLLASIQQPAVGEIYNVCDSLPAPAEAVTAYAAQLAGVPVPPAEPYETAALSPMARSFYQNSRRVDNRKIRNELGVDLLYPDYKAGLAALLKGA